MRLWIFDILHHYLSFGSNGHWGSKMTGISNGMTGITDSGSGNSMSNSGSMSISVSNWCSNSRSSNGRSSNSGSMSISNWCGNSMNSWLVDSDMVLVDHRGFYYMLDWVNFVGFGYSIGLGYFNGVRFGNMFFN